MAAFHTFQVYTGELCAKITEGYMLTCAVIAALYPTETTI